MGRFDVGAEFPTATVGASAGRPKARRSLRWASNRKAQLSEPWTDYGLMTQLSSDSISATRPAAAFLVWHADVQKLWVFQKVIHGFSSVSSARSGVGLQKSVWL